MYMYQLEGLIYIYVGVILLMLILKRFQLSLL